MGRDDEQALLPVVGVRHAPEPRRALQPAIPAGESQAAGFQGFREAGEIEVAHAIYAPLEALAIPFRSERRACFPASAVFRGHAMRVRLDDHGRIKEAPRPSGAQAHGQDQGIVRVERRVAGERQTPLGKVDGQDLGPLVEAVAVIRFGRIEQVIGKPGFMRDPGENEKRRNPGGSREEARSTKQEREQDERDALFAPVASQKEGFTRSHFPSGVPF